MPQFERRVTGQDPLRTCGGTDAGPIVAAATRITRILDYLNTCVFEPKTKVEKIATPGPPAPMDIHGGISRLNSAAQPRDGLWAAAKRVCSRVG